jgi:hypothetical protein
VGADGHVPIAALVVLVQLLPQQRKFAFRVGKLLESWILRPLLWRLVVQRWLRRSATAWSMTPTSRVIEPVREISEDELPQGNICDME